MAAPSYATACPPHGCRSGEWHGAGDFVDNLETSSLGLSSKPFLVKTSRLASV